MTATPDAYAERRPRAAADEPRYTLTQLGLAPSPDPQRRREIQEMLAQPIDERAYARLRREIGIEPHDGDAALLDGEE